MIRPFYSSLLVCRCLTLNICSIITLFQRSWRSYFECDSLGMKHWYQASLWGRANLSVYKYICLNFLLSVLIFCNDVLITQISFDSYASDYDCLTIVQLALKLRFSGDEYDSCFVAKPKKLGINIKI